MRQHLRRQMICAMTKSAFHLILWMVGFQLAGWGIRDGEALPVIAGFAIALVAGVRLIYWADVTSTILESLEREGRE